MATNRIKGITIELDGDTTKLQSALKGVNNSIRTTQSALKDVNNLLKLDPTNTELLTQKQNYLRQSVEDTRSKLETEKKALEQLAQANGAEKPTEEMKALEREVISTTEYLKGAEKELKNFGSVGAQQIAAVGNKLKSLGSTLTNIGSKMTATLTVPIVAAGTVAVKAASDMEENINKVEVAFGNSAQAVKDFAETATTQFGLSKNAALEAASLFGDMGTSMGLAQDEAADMSIALTGLAGDLSSFKNVGIDQAMTALNGVFTGETESLKQLGVVMTQTNLEEFASGMGLVYSEMSQAEKVTLRYQYVLAQTKNAQGDYARTSDGTANSMRTLQASLDNLAATFGEVLIPIITPIINKVTEVIQRFGELDEGTKKIIVTVLGVIAVVGPLLMVIGGIVSAIGSIMTLAPMLGAAFAALAGPVGIVIGIIAAVIAIGVALYKNWDTIKEKATELKEWVVAKFNELVEGIRERIEFIKTVVTVLWTVLKESVTVFFESIKNYINEKIENIKNAFTLMGTALKTIVTALWNGIKTAFTTGFNIVDKLTGGKLGEIADAFRNTFSNLISSAMNWGRDIIQGIVDGIKSKIEAVKNSAKAVANAIREFLHFSEPDKGPLSDFHTYMPDMMDLMAKGMIDNLPKIESAASTVAGTIANQTSNNSYNYGGVNIVINGTSEQTAQELAAIVEERINQSVRTQEAAWA